MSVPPEMMDSGFDTSLANLPSVKYPQGRPGGLYGAPTSPNPLASPSLAAMRQPPPKPGPKMATKPAAEPTATQAASKMGAKGDQYLSEDIETYREDSSASRKAAQQYGRDLESQPPIEPQVFKESAPKYADFAKQVSPFLMIATVLGGKAMKISGQGMMGALTGMVQGTAEGNAERYETAYKEYQDHYKRFKEEEDNRVAYRNELLKWHKGKMDAAQIAAQESMAMVGADEKMIQMGVNADKALTDTALKISQQNLRLTQLQNQIAGQQFQREKFEFKQTQDKDKAVAVLSKYKTSALDMKRSWDNLKAYVAKHPEMKSMLNLATLTNSDALEKLIQIGDDEGSKAVADFKSYAAAFMGPGFRDQIQGIPAAALRSVKVDQAEMAALPDLQKTGWNQTDATINRIVDALSKADLSGNASSAPQGEQGSVEQAASAAFGSYEPSKYDYRINPDTGKVQRKPR